MLLSSRTHPFLPALRPALGLVLAWLALAADLGAVERPRIRIGVESGSPPISFLDETNRWNGFSAELLQFVAREGGIDFEYVHGPWTLLFQEFSQGRLDALANTAVTPERRATMDFSIGHSALHASTYTLPGTRPFRTTVEFHGHTMALTQGTITQLNAAAHGYWGARPMFYPSRQATFDAVRKGESDFALHLMVTRNDALAAGLGRAFVDDIVQRFHVAVHRGDTRTLDTINEGLAAVMRSGEFDRIYERWIGPIEPHPIRLADLRPYSGPLLVVALAVGGLFWWQRRVSSKLRRLAGSLAESESRFRGLSEHALVGCYILQDGSFTYANPALAAIFGYEPRELIGRSHECLVHADDLMTVNDHLRQRRDHGVENIRYGFRGIHRNGSVLEIEVMGSRLELAGGSAVIGNILDVTEHRRAERLLRESLADLEEAQRVARVGSWRLDLDTNRIVWTEQLYRMLGLDPGRPPPDLASHPRLFTPESWRRLSPAIEAARTDGIPYEMELESIRTDGSHGWMMVRGEPFRSPSGRIVGLRGMAQDITQRKSLERQLFETQRLDSIGLLASGIAHDLNNILTPILLSLQMLRLDHPEENEALDLVEQNTRRGIAIVRQVLTFSRGMDGTREPTRIGRLVEELGNLMGETLPKNIALTYQLDATEDTARVDPTQIHQVLLNLAVNARDAMPDGGRLGFHLTNETLPGTNLTPAGPLPPGKYVVITVTDTGSGIPPEILPRIFDPFFTTKPRGQGTGLGLSTVHGIVRSHGGSIQVRSVPGHGTTFRILLPVERSPARAPRPSEPVRLIEGRGRLILLADDEPSIRRVAAKVLEKHGFAVLLAEDGQQAVELFRRRGADIHCVILDRMMPNLGGEVAAGVIHQLRSEVPIVLSTGLLGVNDPTGGERNLQEAGISEILRKPYAEDDLLAVISRLLGRVRQSLPSDAPKVQAKA